MKKNEVDKQTSGRISHYLDPLFGWDVTSSVTNTLVYLNSVKHKMSLTPLKINGQFSRYFWHADVWQFLCENPQSTQIPWDSLSYPMGTPLSQDLLVSDAIERMMGENLPLIEVVNPNTKDMVGLIHLDKLLRVYWDGNKYVSEQIKTFKDNLRMKDEFIGIVTHDIRSPLGVIQICVEYLLGQGNEEKNLTEEQLDFLFRVQNNNSKALTLVSDLLDLGRLRDTGVALNQREVVLKQYLQKIAEEMKPLATRRQMTLTNRSTTEDTVILDPKRFQQIVDNFIGNAIKFSSPGGEIFLDSEIIIRNQKKIAKISVTDQGIGIPADKLNDIFKKYEQVENLEAAKTLGVGLGLTIAQQFARLHHATIEVTSQEGKGSTFSILLPVIVAIPAEEATDPIARKRILAVEDDEDILSYLNDVLKEGDFEVITAVDGLEATNLYMKFQPDLVISDIKMPKMDGFELLQFVKNHNKDIPFILVSGYYPNINNDIAKLVFKADSIVSKPFEVDSILNAINNCFNENLGKSDK